MYGTLGRLRVKPEGREPLAEVLGRATPRIGEDGVLDAFLLFEDDGEHAWVLTLFEDRDAHRRFARDDATRATRTDYGDLLLEPDQWVDGDLRRIGPMADVQADPAVGSTDTGTETETAA